MVTPYECIVDSDAFNALVLNEAILDLVRSAVRAGQLTLRCSRVTLAEVADTPDETRRAALLRLPVSPVIPIGVIGGDRVEGKLTRPQRRLHNAAGVLGDMMLGSERDGEVYDAVRTRTRSEPDAVLAATGHHYGLPVVTSDGSLLAACRELDVACLHVDELIAKLRN